MNWLTPHLQCTDVGLTLAGAKIPHAKKLNRSNIVSITKSNNFKNEVSKHLKKI